MGSGCEAKRCEPTDLAEGVRLRDVSLLNGLRV
jgi:hypothetical protein